MRYVGPTTNKLRTPEEREELLFLRKKAGQLFNIMATSGQKSGTLRGTRPDGTPWSVRIIGAASGIPLVFLKAAKKLTTTTTTEPTFEQEEFGVFFMESGFVVYSVLPGLMYQNADTRLKHDSYQEALFGQLEPKDYRDNGEEAYTFTELDKQELFGEGIAQQYFPDNYTGLLKRLVAAKLGRYFTESDTDLAPYTIMYPTSQRLSGEGVVRTEAGAYWFVKIGNSGYSGEAYPLSSPLQGILFAAKQQYAITDVQFQQIEAYFLAYASLGDPITITFSGDTPEGLPLAYGWKFSGDGLEASCITHVSAPADHYLYDAYLNKVVFSLSSDPEIGCFATVTCTFREHWAPSTKALFWYPVAEIDPPEMCFLEQLGDAEAQEAPVYCYYRTRNDGASVLVEFKYSTSYTENRRDLDKCGNVGAIAPRYDISHTNKPRELFSYSGLRSDTITTTGLEGGDVAVESRSGAFSGWRYLQVNTTFAEEVLSPGVACCNGIGLGIGLWDVNDDCYPYTPAQADFGNIPWDSCYPDVPDDWVPPEPNTYGCCCYQIFRTYTYAGLDDISENAFGTWAAGVALIAPFRGAETGLVIQGTTESRISTVWHGQTPLSAKLHHSLQERAVIGLPNPVDPNIEPCCGSASIEGPLMGYAFGAAYTTQWSEQFNDNTPTAKRHFFVGGKSFDFEWTGEPSNDPFVASPWDGWLSKWLPPDDCSVAYPYTVAAKLCEGVKVFDAVEVQNLEDFPEQADLIVGWV